MGWRGAAGAPGESSWDQVSVGDWSCLGMGRRELGEGESQDWGGTAGRSWAAKHRLQALYPLGQWLSFERND